MGLLSIELVLTGKRGDVEVSGVGVLVEDVSLEEIVEVGVLEAELEERGSIVSVELIPGKCRKGLILRTSAACLIGSCFFILWLLYVELYREIVLD
jgi:hypothetical protein